MENVKCKMYTCKLLCPNNDASVFLFGVNEMIHIPKILTPI